jgi:hypothetical protein
MHGRRQERRPPAHINLSGPRGSDRANHLVEFLGSKGTRTHSPMSRRPLIRVMPVIFRTCGDPVGLYELNVVLRFGDFAGLPGTSTVTITP